MSKHSDRRRGSEADGGRGSELICLGRLVGLRLRELIGSGIVVADYKSTKELFGERGDEKTLDNFIPKSDTDFLEYAELVSQKLRPFEKSYHYIALLKDVMRLSMSTLKAADAKDVASSVTAIANEKLNAEKEANAGKKKAPRKKPFLVDKPNDEMVVTSYDALDDYDFM
nr:eukaryotic translation initiation factor 3 subunit j [Quercus suber]